ncbi:unnamed protein product [Mycena citricolor]|uniref:Uncharacterized protein n=1 Tax=Mycena citricolor TaxID=2018698 RepID=A0AAD2GYS7_9AGAR|nr:unnamed protein product [Mycena citricolor]
MTTNPDVDRLLSGLPPWSASLYVVKSSPWLGDLPLKSHPVCPSWVFREAGKNTDCVRDVGSSSYGEIRDGTENVEIWDILHADNVRCGRGRLSGAEGDFRVHGRCDGFTIGHVSAVKYVKNILPLGHCQHV